MVKTIENQMIRNRLAGGEFDLKLNIKGKQIPEKSQSVLLGLNCNRDMSWTGHTERIIEKYNKKVGGLAKACGFLDKKQLVKAFLISHL